MAQEKTIYIYGGKGNGTVVLAALLDYLDKNNDFIIGGFFNNQWKDCKKIDGYDVLGDIDHAKNYVDENNLIIPAISSVKTMEIVRTKISGMLMDINNYLFTFIHPTAFIGYNVNIGPGVFIGPQSYLGQNSTLGLGTFIHSHVYIARDTKIGKFSYFSPKSFIGTEVITGEFCYVGTGATVKERCHLGNNSVIGMGSLILCDTENDSVYYGPKAERKR